MAVEVADVVAGYCHRYNLFLCLFVAVGNVPSGCRVNR
jgi:hypothetical protein